MRTSCGNTVRLLGRSQREKRVRSDAASHVPPGPLNLVIGGPLDVDQLAVGLADGTQQVIQFEMERLGVAILRTLY